MDESFDREKIIDCMFDPITSEILAKLEDGKKECSVLSQEFSMSESDILQRLDYLIECEFIFKTNEKGFQFPLFKGHLSNSLQKNCRIRAWVLGPGPSLLRPGLGYLFRTQFKNGPLFLKV